MSRRSPRKARSRALSSASSTPSTSGAIESLGVAQAISAMATLSFISGGDFGPLAPKPAKPGTLGMAVTVTTNMFAMSLKSDVAYHYDLTIKRRRQSTKASSGPPTKRKTEGKGRDDGAGPSRGRQADDAQIKKAEDLKRIFLEFEKNLKNPGSPFHGVKLAFDGVKNLYSYDKPFNQGSFELEMSLTFDGVEDTFIFQVKPTGTGHVINLSERTPEALQAIEIGLIYNATKRMISRKRDLFERNRDCLLNVPYSNLFLSLGVRKSVRITENGLVLNIDQAAAVFQAGGNLNDVMRRICPEIDRKGGLQHFVMDRAMAARLTKELKGFRITVPQNDYIRKYTISSFTSGSISQEKFEFGEDKQEITVYHYFKEYRNPKLPNLQRNLPCIVVSNGSKIPIEICTLLPEQYYAKKLEGRIQAYVTNHTVTKPTERMAKIRSGLQTISRSAQDCLEVTISNDPIEADARIIPAPRVNVGGGNVTQPKIENRNDRGNPGDFKVFKLTQPVNLQHWMVCVLHSELREDLKVKPPAIVIEFAQKLSTKARDWGMSINPKFTYGGSFQFTGAMLPVRDFLRKAKDKLPGLQMMMVIKPLSDPLYHLIKTVGNTYQVITQCLELDVSNRADMDRSNRNAKAGRMLSYSFLENMILKMNAKLGGENFKLDQANLIAEKTDLLKRTGLMVMGIDITHPGVGDELKHSIAGFVGSYTPDLTKYICQARSQLKERQEIIQEDIRTVGEVAEEFFDFYKKKHKQYPSTLIVFRDGVSEGQFMHVRNHEVHQLLKTMEKLGMKCELVYITVQKRHHFRMVVKNTDRSGKVSYDNVKPGTVLDRFVVHPERFECYLNSHHALKGTARPCHYCVIFDNSNPSITSDQMQSLAYYLCYICARCTKPISHPAPTRYAHLVAEKAAGYVKTRYQQGKEDEIDTYARIQEFQQDKLFYA